MKRFWLVLLSLGLVMAFCASAFAVDVNVSGEYFVGGLYLNKISVNDSILQIPARLSFIKGCASKQILSYLRV